MIHVKKKHDGDEADADATVAAADPAVTPAPPE